MYYDEGNLQEINKKHRHNMIIRIISLLYVLLI